MQSSVIQQRLKAYRHWKTRVSRAVLELEGWLESEGQATADSREQIRLTLETLDKDRLTIAFVAEFSRGKTALINAIFFADYGRRILPSAAGRTTLCPTELLWDDEQGEAFLRLLPIETRAQDLSIAEIKRDPKQWVHHPLNLQDPEQMTSTLDEILRTKKVSAAEATRLGLTTIGLKAQDNALAAGIEIPKWRHAIVSFPHPLLKQGLVILDTPGLDALGKEPELTLGMLPAAQTILFVLAADTGVAGSDLVIWQHHLKGFKSARQQGIIVALNKIDLLWERPADGRGGEAAVARQRADAARVLDIKQEAIFPVSAQKGLLAKIQDDSALLNKSALPALESHLSRRMLETKHRVLVDALDAGMGELLERNRNRIGARINAAKAQLKELEQLREKSDGVIEHLLERTRREQELYLEGVHLFRASREDLLEQTRLGRQILNRDNMESLTEKAYRDLVRSWTTPGLARSMTGLFQELHRAMQTLASESEHIGNMVRVTYQRFAADFGFTVPPPEAFAADSFLVEIELLHQEVEDFTRSAAMILSEQASVIKRFRRELVGRALALFDQLRLAFDAWIRDALRPLADQIREHKLIMEKRLENLQRIGRSKDNLQSRIDDLHKQYVELAQRLTALRNIHNALHYDPLVDEQLSRKPHLVAGKA